MKNTFVWRTTGGGEDIRAPCALPLDSEPYQTVLDKMDLEWLITNHHSSDQDPSEYWQNESSGSAGGGGTTIDGPANVGMIPYRRMAFISSVLNIVVNSMFLDLVLKGCPAPTANKFKLICNL